MSGLGGSLGQPEASSRVVVGFVLVFGKEGLTCTVYLRPTNGSSAKGTVVRSSPTTPSDLSVHHESPSSSRPPPSLPPSLRPRFSVDPYF